MSRSFPLSLSLCSCFQSMIHFEIPLKRSLFDIKRVWREWEKEWVKKNFSQRKNHTPLTSWLSIQSSLLRLVCFSLSPMISICIEILLFDVWGLLSLFFFSPLCICLFKTMTFFFIFRMSIDEYICLIIKRRQRQTCIMAAAIPCLHIPRTNDM